MAPRLRTRSKGPPGSRPTPSTSSSATGTDGDYLSSPETERERDSHFLSSGSVVVVRRPSQEERGLCPRFSDREGKENLQSETNY